MQPSWTPHSAKKERAGKKERGARPTVLLVSDRRDWHVREIEKALTELGARTVHADLASCSFDSDQPFGLTIPGLSGRLPDAVLVRAIATGSFEAITRRLGILHALHRLNVLVWNDAAAIERCVDKSMASFLLAQQGLPTPPTFAVETREAARTILDRQAKGVKLVLKPLFGSQGRGLRLISRADELPDPEGVCGVYYLQRYQGVEDPYGFRDFRLLVSAGRVIAAMMRQSPMWITNVKQGGRPVSAVIDAPMQTLAIAAAAALGAGFAGVDILVGEDGRPTILEVNSMPAWSGLQKVANRNVAAMICADLMSTIDARRSRTVT
jgi:RimK family alpha-L-glutamate ligase